MHQDKKDYRSAVTKKEAPAQLPVSEFTTEKDQFNKVKKLSRRDVVVQDETLEPTPLSTLSMN